MCSLTDEAKAETLNNLNISKMENYIVRKLKIGCTTSIGEERKSFTVDENDKQNSPSFSSFNEFCDWKNQVRLYGFRYDLMMTGRNYLDTLNATMYAK